eukprot:Gb_06356 [translate_table: standard]
MNSFNNYGKVDDATGRSSSRRKKLIIIALVASVVLVAISISVAVGVVRTQNSEEGKMPGEAFRASNKAIDEACSNTLYREVCVSTLAAYSGSARPSSMQQLSNVAVNASIGVVEKTQSLASSLSGMASGGLEQSALQDCIELLDDTADELNASMAHMMRISVKDTTPQAGNILTWLSASLTNQDTCMDGLDTTDGIVKTQLQGNLQLLSQLVSNSLAIVKRISDLENSKLNSGHNRRLLSVLNDNHPEFDSHYGSIKDGFPTWLSAGDRRLLQTPQRTIQADAVVAKDGSGNYTTITDAVKSAPEKSDRRYVIHVKAGVYEENVVIKKKKTNLVFIGDGMNATVVTGRKNFVDGTTTFRSATFAASGNGFIARDMSFENTAGPWKHQAVALRVGSDLSVLYRCSFKGYQDTLYAHSQRQFYRECNIYGTVDFIFGNAAVVFQRCVVLARKPLDNQKITITAQGRKDPNQNTGISIQTCNVTAAPDLVPLKNSTQVYLGRPWKEYSTTVIMESYLDDIIRPEGWLEWMGDFALDTLFYGEYMNSGPGAGVARRVTWPGYRPMNSSEEASKFTVAQFIDGNKWLPSTGVKFVSGLIV